MRKPAAALISILLIAAVAGTLFDFLAKANFSPTPQPEVLISSPTGTVNSSNASLTVTVIVYGRFIYGSQTFVESVRWLTYSIDRSPEHQIDIELPLTKIPTEGQPEDKYAGNAILSNLPEGKHGITILGESTFNNTIYKFAYFTVDTSPPDITILSPANTTYTEPSIPLDFTLNEPTSNISYSLDGQPRMAIAENLTLPTMTFGSHSLTVYATDAVGNTGVSQTTHFTIFDESEPSIPSQDDQNSFPTVPLAAASAASIATVIAAGLIFARRRRRKEAQQK